MTKPVVIQLLDKIKDRLELITTSNGYYNDVQSGDIHRAKLTPFKGYDLPAINYWSGATTTVEHGAGFKKKRTEIFIEMHSKTRDNPFVDVSEEMGADIVIALHRDIASPLVSDNPSFKLGDTIDGLYVESIVPEIGEGQSPFYGVMVTIALIYRIKQNDPFVILT